VFVNPGGGLWWGSSFYPYAYSYGYPYAYGGYPYAAGAYGAYSGYGYEAPAVQETAPAYAQDIAPAPYYWYYCEAASAYYPYVRECPTGWLRVLPEPPPPGTTPPTGGGQPSADQD
jgi:hypothetical protein